MVPGGTGIIVAAAERLEIFSVGTVGRTTNEPRTNKARNTMGKMPRINALR